MKQEKLYDLPGDWEVCALVAHLLLQRLHVKAIGVVPLDGLRAGTMEILDTGNVSDCSQLEGALLEYYVQAEYSSVQTVHIGKAVLGLEHWRTTKGPIMINLPGCDLKTGGCNILCHILGNSKLGLGSRMSVLNLHGTQLS